MLFVIRTIRNFFFVLDSVVYGFIADVYALLVQLNTTSVFNAEMIAEFATRIYALAALFMLFKVSISFVHYVINPDDFTDKEKGFAGIIRRIVFSLALLVLTPYIFREAFRLQQILLQDNIIMNLVFGQPPPGRMSNEEAVLNAGRHMQFVLMYNFMQPNFNSMPDLEPCRVPYIPEGNDFARRPNSQFILALNPACFGEYDPETDTYDTSSVLARAFDDGNQGNEAILFQHYAQAVAQQSFALLMRREFIDLHPDTHRWATTQMGLNNTDAFVIHYPLFISTIVGAVTVYLLLLFCIDIAIRSVKLGFLEMIAPIPILSYIDPKSSKDKGMFHQWYKLCVSTYVSLFLRLFALFLGIYVITRIGGYHDFVTGASIRGNWLLDVFMIIGILIFAKQLPKIIEDMFGVKLDGKFSLNPLKRIEEEAIGGKRLTGALGGAVGGLARGPGGIFGGAMGGLVGGKGFTDARKNKIASNAALRQAQLDGSTFGGRMGARASNFLGTGGAMASIAAEKTEIQDNIDRVKKEKEKEEAAIAPIQTGIKQKKETASAVKAMQDRGVSKVKQGNGAQGMHYQDLLRQAEEARTGTGRYAGSADGGEAVRLEHLAETYANTSGRDAWINHNLSAPDGDEELFDLYSTYRTKAEISEGAANVKAVASDFKAQGTTINTDITTAQNEISNQEQTIARYDDQIKGYNVQMQKVSEREARAKADQSAVGRGGGSSGSSGR